jgi:hypothetical protein
MFSLAVLEETGFKIAFEDTDIRIIFGKIAKESGVSAICCFGE